MIHHFKVLSSEEYEDVKNAISLITVLVAGADGHIKHKEIEWAEKLTNIRSFSLPEDLSEYYKDVGEDFHDRLNNMIEALPSDTEERQKIIGEALSNLNPILAKIHPQLAAGLYDSFISFAKHVAKASGGFMRFFSISSEEKHVMGLDMIHPIVYEGEE